MLWKKNWKEANKSPWRRRDSYIVFTDVNYDAVVKKKGGDFLKKSG